MKLGDLIAKHMAAGLSAAEAAEAAQKDMAEAAEKRSGPLIVELNLKPLHRDWLERKCAAHNVSISAFLRKAVAEMWQTDEWRRRTEALEPGQPGGTMLREDFKRTVG